MTLLQYTPWGYILALMTSTLEHKAHHEHPQREQIEIPIEGMSCASCATRVEKSLNQLDGVEANVNFALKRAAVEYDETVAATSDLAEAVRTCTPMRVL